MNDQDQRRKWGVATNIGIGLGVLLLGASVFYYLVVFIPTQRRVELNAKAETTNQNVEEEYKRWQEQKIKDDIKMVEAKLKERRKDPEQTANDQHGYDIFGDVSFYENGEFKTESKMKPEEKKNLIQNTINQEEDQDAKERIKQLIEDHPTWWPADVVNVVHGELDVGMTTEQIALSWGRPSKTLNNDTDGYELWWYWTGARQKEKTRDLLVFSNPAREEGALLFTNLER